MTEIKLTEAIACYYAYDELMDYINEQRKEISCEQDKWASLVRDTGAGDPDYNYYIRQQMVWDQKLQVINDVLIAANEAMKNGRER